MEAEECPQFDSSGCTVAAQPNGCRRVEIHRCRRASETAVKIMMMMMVMMMMMTMMMMMMMMMIMIMVLQLSLVHLTGIE